MKKPLIAVTPLYDMKKNSLWMLPGYLNGVLQAGGIPVILPLLLENTHISEIVAAFDGFLFTGGQDVNPQLYGEEKQPYCEEILPQRDKLETLLMEAALEANKPVFGICRGMQLMNVVLGGSLYQDIPTQYASPIPTIKHSQESDYGSPVHGVSVLPGTPLAALFETDVIQVNSLHHQAIKKLAPGLVVNALSEDGLIEAIHLPEKKFFLGVQWHPEFLAPHETYAVKLFSAFVGHCQRDQ